MAQPDWRRISEQALEPTRSAASSRFRHLWRETWIPWTGRHCRPHRELRALWGMLPPVILAMCNPNERLLLGCSIGGLTDRHIGASRQTVW